VKVQTCSVSAYCLAAVMLICLGVAVRAYRLHQPLMWVDEAESSINALTILEHGLPVDHYLGLPIYENTLVKPWPEHREYEFRDLSYSDCGLAVYHGWLPIYAMAAVMKLGGLTPDAVTAVPVAQHDLSELARRTWLPRLPAVLFSVVFMLALLLLARALYGWDAALAVLVWGAGKDHLVDLGRTARYYSATLAMSTLCAYAIWRIYRRGQWRDYLLAASAFILLFHTHILSAMVLAIVFAVLLPFAVKINRQLLLRLTAMAAMVIAGTLPWLLAVGFFSTVTAVPKIWQVMELPADLTLYLQSHPLVMTLLTAGLLWLLLLRLPLAWPQRWRQPLQGHGLACALLFTWMIVAYMAFSLLIPAVSYYETRLSLMVTTPAWLFIAIIIAALFRALPKPRSYFWAPAAMLLLLLVSGNIAHDPARPRDSDSWYADLLAYMQQWQLPADTRIYCTPNDHLVLTYYSGMPVQSVAPVRESFFAECLDPVVVIVPRPGHSVVEEDAMATVAACFGHQKLPDQLLDLFLDAYFYEVYSFAASLAVEAIPAPTTLPMTLPQAIEMLQTFTRDEIKLSFARIPAVRNVEMQNWYDWWPTYFYRFSDYQQRWRQHLNYGSLTRNHGRAVILRWGGIVFDCTGVDAAVPLSSAPLLDWQNKQFPIMPSR